MFRNNIFSLSAISTLPCSVVLGLTLAAATPATSAPLDTSLLVGSWKLTAANDLFADGRKRDTWGALPDGMLTFTANGTFMVIFAGIDRKPQPGTIPTDPVGPIVAYFGTYTVDAANNSLEYHVQSASWPQWNGAILKRSIEVLSPTTLKLVNAPINDPKGGTFQPHNEFARIK